MVSITLTLSCLGAFAAMVTAVPVDDASSLAVFARAEATVFMCDDTRFRGRCRTDVIQTGSCYNVPADFVDRISSIRNNDRNRDNCIWYRERECRGESYRNQDDDNLADGNGRFNDAIRSYECRRK
ncbi:hypothetical protein BDP81DRAFT_334403 [Colletotrichum phormii]|uniref:Beta/gamma crystallin 'Greek key' domain-containing protein n=1 Tax=Colletotrichum phormii TaxID=359342 RepID=A0AAI9ZDB2_9PEZI|nr:uncharacterized protein BDP81DRAFT_334403 [Colletotrichum phormii]KAK1622331.1 hypothetical protein BDP81DRAFT_334403 [Colletotrichum phormii]